MIDFLAHVALFGTFAVLLWFPVILLITLLTPKQLLNNYFKQPHFNAGELIVFGSFPGFCMRTALFCRFYLTPKAVKGRDLKGFVEASPRWYKLSVILVILGCLINALIAFTSMAVVLLIK